MKTVAKILLGIAYFFFAFAVMFLVMFLIGNAKNLDVIYLFPSFGFERKICLIAFFITLVPFAFFGIISHIILKRSELEGKADMASYILSFPPYIVIWLVLLALLAVVKFIDIMIYMFTGGEKGLGNVVSFFFGATFGNKKKQTVAAANSEVYTVIDSGFERVLTMVESKQDADPDSPYYTKYYNRFRDDLGYYWRSYDQNEHFIKETVEQRSRGY